MTPGRFRIRSCIPQKHPPARTAFSVASLIALPPPERVAAGHCTHALRRDPLRHAAEDEVGERRRTRHDREAPAPAGAVDEHREDRRGDGAGAEESGLLDAESRAAAMTAGGLGG